MSNTQPYEAAVGIPTIYCEDLLVRAVDSLMGQDIRINIIIVCNGNKVRETCEKLEAENDDIAVYYPGKNLGVSASWNFLAQQAYDREFPSVTIMGDDLTFSDYDGVRKLTEEAEKDPNAVYYVYNRGFSAYTLPLFVWNKVGEFDEGFWPGYFEDNDYFMRMMIEGVGWRGIKIETEHLTSSSITRDPYLKMLNYTTFPLNEARYIAKWGGKPHNETFKVAWNGGAEYPNIGDQIQ